jgi:hypothetical protein
MKTNLVTLFLLVICITTKAQNDPIPEPEYAGNIVLVDGTKTKPLEKQKVSLKAKAGATMYVVGVGKVKASNIVTGARSPIRTQQRDSLTFIVRVQDNSTDPFNLINIFQLNSNTNKNQRSIEVASAGTFSGSSSNDIDLIPFVAKKYGEKSYILTIQRILIPGEYAITVEGSRDVFNLFGVE